MPSSPFSGPKSPTRIPKPRLRDGTAGQQDRRDRTGSSLFQAPRIDISPNDISPSDVPPSDGSGSAFPEPDPVCDEHSSAEYFRQGDPQGDEDPAPSAYRDPPQEPLFQEAPLQEVLAETATTPENKPDNKEEGLGVKKQRRSFFGRGRNKRPLRVVNPAPGLKAPEPQTPEPQTREPQIPEPEAPAFRQTVSARPVFSQTGSVLTDDTPGEGKLVASNIAKSFGKRKILRDVGLCVSQGEVVGLLGPNGAGKTTSFYIVCGLLKPDAGSVSIHGKDVSHLPVYRRARLGLGYLPQEASIFRGLNVEKNILSVLETRYSAARKRRARLEELLDDFSIQHIRKSPSLALSGGERRRVEIARALAADPAFILLDEPFAGVDPIAVGDIRNLVSQLKNRGIGVLITDHNVRDTLSVVDRAYIIFDGQVLKQGSPAEIVADDRVRKVYLGDRFSL